MISAICIASGRLCQLQESISSFLKQDYADRELIIVNTLQRQTLVLDAANIRILNVKQTPCMPMQAKNWAVGEVRGDVVIAWDESSVYLPGFLTQVVGAMEGREWCWLNTEFCLDAHGVIRKIQGTEFSFAFRKSAFSKCGPYRPGINGASDRNLIGVITRECPGQNTVNNAADVNLIKLGTMEERERIGADIRCGQIRLQPNWARDYESIALTEKTGKREKRLCVVELGRYGDIINILPALQRIHELYDTPHLMVSHEFADLIEGVSYVKPYVTTLKNEKLGAALSAAKQDFQYVLCAGVWGENYQQRKTTKSYNEESYANLGMLDVFRSPNRPLFDQRNADRERELVAGIRGYDSRPMILVNVTKAVSSPCAHCAEILADVEKVWGQDYHVVDLAQYRAHRLFDFLGVFEASACLISIDTAWLHLATATAIPVVAIVNPKGDGWAATQVRCGNAVITIPYNKVHENSRQAIHEGIAAALERKPVDVVDNVSIPRRVAGRVFHVVDRFEADEATEKRCSGAYSSWDDLYQNGSLLPIHMWPEHFDRNATEIGDPRMLPYLKDLLLRFIDNSEPGDICLWTNCDTIIHPLTVEWCRIQCSVYGPCSFFRSDFHNPPSLELSPEDYGKRSTVKHIGRDAFAFPREWLVARWDEIPDWILAAANWDLAMAAMVRLHYGIHTTAGNLGQQMFPAEPMLGYVGHKSHSSAWNQEQFRASPSNLHNGKLFKEWASKHAPQLKFTPEGNLAL